MELYISQNLRYLRKKKGVNQSVIALQVGKGHTTIGNWEKGIIEPTLTELTTLASYFEISMQDLMFKDLNDAHLNEIGDKKIIEENAQVNAQANAQVKPENYQENDKTSFVNDSGGQNAKSPVVDQAKYVALLEKYNQLLEEKLIEHSFQYKFEDVQATVKALQELLLRGHLSPQASYEENWAVYRKTKNDALIELGIVSGDST